MGGAADCSKAPTLFLRVNLGICSQDDVKFLVELGRQSLSHFTCTCPQVLWFTSTPKYKAESKLFIHN